MNKHDWDFKNDPDFEELLETSLTDLPPEDIVAEVTPWKKAMNRVLIGMAFAAITLNFWCLNYILPAIGIVLTLLGFRTLQRENKWFRNCYIITAIRMFYLFAILILNTTILQNTVYGLPFMKVISAANIVLMFVLLVCFRLGLRGVQSKAGLEPHAGSAGALIVWFLILCFLALIQYKGIIIAGAMIIGYVFIIRSLWKLSKELDEAGYAVETAPIRISGRALVSILLVVLLIGCSCGYLFGSKYPMDWTVVETSENYEISAIRDHLLSLGFPEDILEDLSAEEIADCEGALQVILDVREHPFNVGRKVTEYSDGSPYKLREPGFYTTTVYDVKELRITGIAVKLPGEREQWKIVQHFEWTVNPGFYGTESIQLWPAYRNYDGWGPASEVSGKILYDNEGVTFSAPYWFLGEKNYSSNSIFWGKRVNQDVFAAFSMPNKGEHHRGYLSYTIAEMRDGSIVDAWINYTHQKTWLQYPAFSAMQQRMANSRNRAGAFHTVQDALQFYPSDEGVELID